MHFIKFHLLCREVFSEAECTIDGTQFTFDINVPLDLGW